MIVVEVTENEVKVTGHAGYAEPGKDIVCAAVSVLTQNLINSVQAFTEELEEYTIAPGDIKIVFKDLSERGKLLIDSFFIGICRIQDAYGSEYVQIR